MPPNGALWAITSYFNPCGYKLRLRNYRMFRQRLTVPLVAVELAYGDRFELQKADAEILIRLRGRDVMWQKERLLNLALNALPAECAKVAWIDCDIVFDNPEWGACAASVLDVFPAAHAFERIDRPPAGIVPGEIDFAARAEELLSFPSAIAAGRASAEMLNGTCDLGKLGIATGFAWAARREILERHAFYDRCIIGSGDRAFLSAAYGMPHDAARYLVMTQSQSQHYLLWAREFFDSISGRVGFVEGRAFHLWHGDLQNRRYVERHERLFQFGFDPASDIALESNGCWRWNSHKPDMHAWVRRYFELRQEDGLSDAETNMAIEQQPCAPPF